MAAAAPRTVGVDARSRPPTKYAMVPTEWKLELPDMGSRDNSEFGGCRRIEDAYDRLVPLGQGTYGEVYKARHKVSGETVAVKKIKMENEKEGFPITAIREIKILSKLATCEDKLLGVLLRDNIIKLREIVRSDSHKSNKDKGSIYMVFDYMEHDMAGLLERANAINREKRRPQDPPFVVGQVKRYILQLFHGLALLQANRVLHRDLKNANLLVSNRGELKIADFGLARHYFPRKGAAAAQADDANVRSVMDDRQQQQAQPQQQEPQMTNRVITLWYRPPELCLGADHYGLEVDMWSAGCIMVEMLTGRAFFPGRDEASQVDLICQVLGYPTEVNMPGCTTLKDYKAIISDRREITAKYPKVSQIAAKLRERGITDEAAVDLVEKLLTLDPHKRIDASTAALHKWFSLPPQILELGEMPKYEESHELGMKNKRQAERMQQADGGNLGSDARRQRMQGPPHRQQSDAGRHGIQARSSAAVYPTQPAMAAASYGDRLPPQQQHLQQGRPMTSAYGAAPSGPHMPRPPGYPAGGPQQRGYPPQPPHGAPPHTGPPRAWQEERR